MKRLVFVFCILLHFNVLANFSIYNDLDEDIDVSSSNCPILGEQIKIRLINHSASVISIPSVEVDECLLKFYRNGIAIFSVVFIGKSPILLYCKNKVVSSQPGYRCELEEELDDYTLTLYPT